MVKFKDLLADLPEDKQKQIKKSYRNLGLLGFIGTVFGMSIILGIYILYTVSGCK